MGAVRYPLQLAFIGPLSGKDSAAGQAMLDGVNLYIAEVNRQGGIHGRNVKVLAYDDRNNKDIIYFAAYPFILSGIVISVV